MTQDDRFLARAIELAATLDRNPPCRTVTTRPERDTIGNREEDLPGTVGKTLPKPRGNVRAGNPPLMPTTVSPCHIGYVPLG